MNISHKRGGEVIKKGITIGFLILFIATSLPVEAFAQTSPDATTASTDTNVPSVPTTDTTPTTSPAPATSDTPTAPSPDTTTAAPTSQSAPASPAPTSQSATLIGGDGSSPISPDLAYSSFSKDLVKIDKNTGALSITYPITIPPGRNNLQPDVDLSYNSQGGESQSIFGEGWSIGIPYIERFNKTGIEKFYSTSTANYFVSTLDGELATTTASSSFVARTENGSFNKYTFSNNAWVMTDKNGTQYTFGSSAATRQDDPSNSSNIYRWILERVQDTNDNYISYSYFKDAGQVYPSSTIYTGNGSTDGIFEIDFLRTASADNATSSPPGFPTHSNYRVSEIDAKTSGSLVRKYALSYATGDNASTTLLGSITQSGQSSLGVMVSLPTSTFSYQVQTPGTVSSSTWNPPVTFVNTYNGWDNGTRIADVNGDNLPDIVQATYYSFQPSTSSVAYINTGNGWVVSSTWNPPTPFTDTYGGWDMGTRLVDVNGDGLPDVLDNSGNAWINNGTGWTSSSTWGSPVTFIDGFHNDLGARIVDVNGDGLPDILQATNFQGGSPSYAAYINNGHGWASDPSWAPPVTFSNTYNGYDTGARLVDINGDGLPDILQATNFQGGSPSYAAWINNGHGWASDSTWNPPVTFIDTYNNADTGARIADINGDGLPDIFDNSGTAYINNGHGWAINTNWNSPVTFVGAFNIESGARIVDANGDGLSDILQATNYQGTSTYSVAYANKNGNRPDILTSIGYPAGGNSKIAYQSATQYADGSGKKVNKEPYPVYVVSGITVNDGAKDVSSSTYQYSGGKYYYADPFNKQFAGFGTVTMTDSAGNVTKTFYHTSNGTDSAHGEYSDNFWKIGKPYRVENYDRAGNLYKKTINKWDSVSLGGNAAFVKLASTTEADYDGLVTHKDLAESYSYDNTNGNQTQKVQYGQVNANDDGTFADIGTDDFIANTTYATSTTGVLGKPSDVIVADHSGSKIKEAQSYYDNLALGSAGAGNLTKESDWKASSSYATSQNTYNSYGLVTSHLDPRNSTTTYAYDSFNLYPATTTNALGQSIGNQYDYSTGKTRQTIDPNGDTAQTDYDGLGRRVAVRQPDPNNPGTLVTSTLYAYIDSANSVSVHESDYMNATTSIDSYTYYDGLGRLVQTRNSAEDAGIYKVADRAYNNVNMLAQESLPYFASGSTKTAPTSTPALFTTYTYDPLQRVLTTSNAVGNTTNAYANWKTTVTDARGNPKDQISDAYGNLIEVDEHNSTSTYATQYAYDGLQNLTNITDALGNVRNFTYDGLGRRLTAQELHPAATSTFGIWNYTYDDAGNLTQQVDAKNQTSTYIYDALNRETSESFGGQVQTAYTYDSCTHGVGRLCTASSSAANASDTYDSLGQLIQEAKTISSSTYVTVYTYDWKNNQMTITNPDNSVIQYAYNLAGLPESVSYKENGGSLGTVVSNFDYSPEDKVATQTDSDGVTIKNIYDPAKIYRLTDKITTGPSFGGGGQAPVQGGAMVSGASKKIQPGPTPFSSVVTTSTITKNYIGALDSYTVPSDVFQISVIAYGAQGASMSASGLQGLGGSAAGTLSVTPGTTYYINVGGAGNGVTGGYNGGGASGGTDPGNSNNGGGGGGMTWLSPTSTFATSSVLLIAGGGGGGCRTNGGSGQTFTSYFGGNGGGLSGSNANTGGFGGTQTSGGTGGSGSVPGNVGSTGQGGQGGSGWSGVDFRGASGGGGGYLGGGGGGAGSQFTFACIGGGGGGSSYMSSLLMSTSTISGANASSGYLTIVEQHVSPFVYSLNQYRADGVIPINQGSSTSQSSVVLSAIVGSDSTSSSQLQIEVEPAGASFTGNPNVTSSPLVSFGSVATTTYTGLNGSYHWQARSLDAQNNSSDWQVFGPNTSSTDFVINAPVPYISSLNQYRADGTTLLSEGSSTFDSNVIFGATLNSSSTNYVQLQAEVEPVGTGFANTPNVTSSPFVVPGSITTTTFTGPKASYHWQARAADVPGNASVWQRFGPSSTSTDFSLIAPTISFTFPTSGTTTPIFSNWILKAGNVTSTDNYKVQVSWDVSEASPIQSSINASGSALLTGINIPKPLYWADYTDTGVPVNMTATSTLYNLAASSTPIATTSVSFYEQTLLATQNCGATQIQCIAYTYDGNGNITETLDNSANSAAKTMDYGYDSLNRLISASSSNAVSGQDFRETYSYDALGNMKSKTGQGNYNYAGTQGTNYANPDAVTSIVNGTSTVNYTYDKNDNLVSNGNATNTWNYKNQLVSWTGPTATSSYAYDHKGDRVKLVESGVTTVFPTKFYNVNVGGAATSTKHIFANGLLVGTVENATTTSGGAATVALDATSTSITAVANSGTVTKSWTHTIGSNATVLVLMADISETTAGAGAVASATWNGASFTKAKAALNSTMDSEIWYLAPTSTGSGTLSVTVTGATQAIKLGAASFAGIATSSPIDASSTATGKNVSPSVSITTATSTDLIVATLSRSSNTNATTNKTVLFNDHTTSTLAAGSYQIATSTGTFSDTYSPSANQNWSMVLVAFKQSKTPITTASSSVVRYPLYDALGGSNLVADASGTIAETLDYYPFGKSRMDNKAGNYKGEKRKFIREEYDEKSGLNYLNARYYDGNRGQFISGELITRALGDVNQIKQLSGQDQKVFLADPQQLNSFSYAKDNPITFTDPTGKYVEVALSGTAMGGSGAIGFRISTQGFNFFVAGGAGAGTAGFPLSISYTPGDVSHKIEESVSIGGNAAYFAGGGVSVNGQFNPYSVGLDNAKIQPSFNLGLGADVYARKELSIPIFGAIPSADLKSNDAPSYIKSNYQPATQNNISKVGSSDTTGRTYVGVSSYPNQPSAASNAKTVDQYHSILSPSSN